MTSRWGNLSVRVERICGRRNDGLFAVAAVLAGIVLTTSTYRAAGTLAITGYWKVDQIAARAYSAY